MNSADLLNQIFAVLANDATFLNFKGLTPTSDIADKAAYIQKGQETDGVVTNETIPICLLYPEAGTADTRTLTVYIGKVVIDCFAANWNAAAVMAGQAQKLLHNWHVHGIYVARFAYDTSFKTGIVGVKGHRVFFDVNSYIG